MESTGALIRFRLDSSSGVPPYRQLVEQVRQAISLGRLRPGDQLPPVREVVTQITINPNTVHRAYRVLESEGLVRGQQGRGTFVLDVVATPLSSARQAALIGEFQQWLTKARQSGLDDFGIGALIASSMRPEGSSQKESGY